MARVDIQETPQVLQGFVAHWTLVNGTLGASPLVLAGNYTLMQFTADRAAIVNAMDAVVVADNSVGAGIVTRDQAKTRLRVRLTQFRAVVYGQIPGSEYANRLPTLPDYAVAESKYIAPFDDMAALWQTINANPPPGFAPPLLLAGNYNILSFNADLTALRAAYKALSDANIAIGLARTRRDALIRPAIERIKQYRAGVVGRLEAGSALLRDIPRYT